MTNEEKVIDFLNTKFVSSETNKVSIYKQDLFEIGLTETELIRAVCLLEQDRLIEDVKRSIHNDLSIPCSVKLKSSCVHYFENKAEKTTSKYREMIRTYIPSVIASISLVVSIATLIITQL